jgi:hypothetical protein
MIIRGPGKGTRVDPGEARKPSHYVARRLNGDHGVTFLLYCQFCRLDESA